MGEFLIQLADLAILICVLFITIWCASPAAGRLSRALGLAVTVTAAVGSYLYFAQLQWPGYAYGNAVVYGLFALWIIVAELKRAGRSAVKSETPARGKNTRKDQPYKTE
jgi:hypothetical protein